MKAKKTWVTSDYHYHLLITAGDKTYHAKFKQVYYTTKKKFKRIDNPDVIKTNKKLKEFDLIAQIKKDFKVKTVTLVNI